MEPPLNTHSLAYFQTAGQNYNPRGSHLRLGLLEVMCIMTVLLVWATAVYC